MTDAEFRIVFEENKDAVYRFAWRMCGSGAVAEDIAQEVFLTLLRQPGRFDPARGALRPFLLAVAGAASFSRSHRTRRSASAKPARSAEVC